MWPTKSPKSLPPSEFVAPVPAKGSRPPSHALLLCVSPLSEALYAEFFHTAEPLEESLSVCVREASFVCAWPAAVQSMGDSAQGSSRLLAFSW